jgi:ABC-type uncharacterized transport system substrate-binding protein
VRGKLFTCWSLLVVLAAVFLSAGAEAQPAGKAHRIGYLSAASGPPEDAFLAGLRELGYVEGRNIIIESRFADGKHERLFGLAGELIALKVDVIVTTGTPAAFAAKRATSAIPIVMAIVADPVGGGLVANLARPGGNITGMADLDTELSEKRLEILKQVVPRLSRVAVLWNPANPAHKQALKESEVAAKALELRLQAVDAQAPSQFGSAFSAMSSERAQALTLLADSMFSAYREAIIKLAAKGRLSAIFWQSSFVRAGGLMSYGPNFDELFRRAAVYVHKIIKGAKPADLPVEQPTKFELVINLKTAKQIGLTIPPNVLARADRVIK